jgi:hypothetical protein
MTSDDLYPSLNGMKNLATLSLKAQARSRIGSDLNQHNIF